jgi:hypothetical protein
MAIAGNQVSRRGGPSADYIRPRYRMRAAERLARRCATRRAASDNALYVRGNLHAPAFHLPGGYQTIRLRAAVRNCLPT